MNDSFLRSWMTLATRTQITRTYYDTVRFTILYNDFSQDYLRGRVSSATYQDVEGTSYNYGTHYSYDVHGNVKGLVQQINSLSSIGQNYKRIDYEYDLVSNKVNKVWYEKGMPDQFILRYTYDADNRLTSVMTTPDGVNWDEDATYKYYYHGPLGRMELGDDKVQGLDYAYTIQGWLKGVNAGTLRCDRDMGKDGLAAGLHPMVGRDAYGFILGYYSGDYSSAGNNNKFQPTYSGTTFSAGSAPLFNGNIRNMITTVNHLGNPQGRVFNYDQLNRLVNTVTFDSLNISTNTWSGTASSSSFYKENFGYDGNGNILSADRNGNLTSTPVMDSAIYEYYPNTNRLKRVRDTVPSARYGNDIDNYTDTVHSDEFVYDKNGNLIQDRKQGIHIGWNVYGKVQWISRTGKDTVFFAYDANGNRAMKKADSTTRWYIRDAQGNIMATYKQKDTFKINEYNIYGSNRIGIYRRLAALDTTMSLADTGVFHHVKGNRRYELTNHLGNVLAVISDRRLAVDSNSNSTTDWYEADMIRADDYYAYGAPMPGRSWYVPVQLDGLVDSCVTCAIMRAKVKSYDSTYGAGSLLDTAQLVTYLNGAFGFHKTAAEYITALRGCHILNESLVLGSGPGAAWRVNFTDTAQYRVGRRNFTVETWFKISDTVTRFRKIFLANLYYNGSNSQTDGFLAGTTGKTLWFRLFDESNGGDPFISIYSHQHFTMNEWHHAVMERIGNNANNFKLYLDGQQVILDIEKNNPLTGNIDSLHINPISIGAAGYYTDQKPFDGELKQVRFYRRAIDSSEIRLSYNDGCGADPSDTTDLTLWAPLYEGYGNTIHDITGYAATATWWESSGADADWKRELDTIACLQSGNAVCEEKPRMGADSYVFGYNGKMKDDEVYGDGDEYDFGDRIYAPKLGQWLSIDPSAKKYPYLSPYLGIGDNPIFYLDNRGRDNVIYLVYLPGTDTKLKKSDIEAIRDQANQNFANLGLKTRVVIVTDFVNQARNFNANKIDKTDAIVVIGNKQNIVDYVTKYDRDFGKELKEDWDANTNNPEHSQNKYSKVPKYGKFIAIEENSIGSFGTYSGIKGGNVLAKTAGLIINHGAGHTANLSHAYDQTQTTTSPIMADANALRDFLTNPNSAFPTLDEVLSKEPNETHPNGRNSDYIAAIQQRFGTNKSKVNYK